MNNATLAVDLSAIGANYQLLKSKHAKGAIAAVVKANAYGLGVEAVSKKLWQEGCREFFVATLEEGIALRGILPDAQIGVFNGLLACEAKAYIQHKLLPVINSTEQLSEAGEQSVIVHVDTGMTRLGLHHSDLQKIPPANCKLVMSHLACANEPTHQKNAEQLSRFKDALKYFPGARASLCNSSGIFLDEDFHFDIGRPGCALYGINPTEDENPMRPVATLSAPILQIRTLEKDETVGYGATYVAKKGGRIAVVALGYADGWLRDLSNRGFAFIEGIKTPIIGRVSMDMIALDVSAIPEIKPASRAEFINAQQTVDDIAAACNTIGYEIFTRIGDRVKRIYA